MITPLVWVGTSQARPPGGPPTRLPALRAWYDAADVASYLLAAGLDAARVAHLGTLLRHHPARAAGAR